MKYLIIALLLTTLVMEAFAREQRCLKSVNVGNCRQKDKKQFYTWNKLNNKCVLVKACNQGRNQNLFSSKSSCNQACAR